MPAEPHIRSPFPDGWHHNPSFWRSSGSGGRVHSVWRHMDGKQHRYWSVVENTRVASGRVVQRHVLYLGEINDTQELAWRRSIEVLEDGVARPRTLSLFPEDRVEGLLADASVVGVRLSELRLQPEVPVEVRE